MDLIDPLIRVFQTGDIDLKEHPPHYDRDDFEGGFHLNNPIAGATRVVYLCSHRGELSYIALIGPKPAAGGPAPILAELGNTSAYRKEMDSSLNEKIASLGIEPHPYPYLSQHWQKHEFNKLSASEKDKSKAKEKIKQITTAWDALEDADKDIIDFAEIKKTSYDPQTRTFTFPLKDGTKLIFSHAPDGKIYYFAIQDKPRDGEEAAPVIAEIGHPPARGDAPSGTTQSNSGDIPCQLEYLSSGGASGPTASPSPFSVHDKLKRSLPSRFVPAKRRQTEAAASSVPPRRPQTQSVEIQLRQKLAAQAMAGPSQEKDISMTDVPPAVASLAPRASGNGSTSSAGRSDTLRPVKKSVAKRAAKRTAPDQLGILFEYNGQAQTDLARKFTQVEDFTLGEGIIYDLVRDDKNHRILSNDVVRQFAKAFKELASRGLIKYGKKFDPNEPVSDPDSANKYLYLPSKDFMILPDPAVNEEKWKCDKDDHLRAGILELAKANNVTMKKLPGLLYSKANFYRTYIRNENGRISDVSKRAVGELNAGREKKQRENKLLPGTRFDSLDHLAAEDDVVFWPEGLVIEV